MATFYWLSVAYNCALLCFVLLNFFRLKQSVDNAFNEILNTPNTVVFDHESSCCIRDWVTKYVTLTAEYPAGYD